MGEDDRWSCTSATAPRLHSKALCPYGVLLSRSRKDVASPRELPPPVRWDVADERSRVRRWES